MKIGGTHFSEEEWVCCHSNLPSSLENRLEWSPQSPGELPWSSASGSSIQGSREDHSHLRALGTGARLQDAHVTTDPSHAHSCPCSPGLLGQVVSILSTSLSLQATGTPLPCEHSGAAQPPRTSEGRNPGHLRLGACPPIRAQCPLSCSMVLCCPGL